MIKNIKISILWQLINKIVSICIQNFRIAMKFKFWLCKRELRKKRGRNQRLSVVIQIRVTYVHYIIYIWTASVSHEQNILIVGQSSNVVWITLSHLFYRECTCVVLCLQARRTEALRSSLSSTTRTALRLSSSLCGKLAPLPLRQPAVRKRSNSGLSSRGFPSRSWC